MIYLDNAATTPLSDSVRAEMLPWITEEFGNPGSVYDLGRKAASAIRLARERVAMYLGCKPEQVIFTGGGSVGNTMVFRGLEHGLRRNWKTHLVVSKAEHESIIRAVAWMQKRGFTVTWLDVDSDGAVSAAQVREAIQPNTGLVSVMSANNELNGRNPVEEIGIACRERDVLFHVDAVQAAGAYPLRPDLIACDFLTISSHKIFGPKGCGALYARDKSLLEPMVFGGENQEYGLHAGTQNVPAIVGFGQACADLTVSPMEDYRQILSTKMIFCIELERQFNEAFLDGVLPDRILHFNSGFTDTDTTEGGKTVSVRFDGVESETLVLMLSTQGVYVSSGSACNSERSVPSRVLLASGLTPEQASQTVRVTFSSRNSFRDAKDAAAVFLRCVKALRAAGEVR